MATLLASMLVLGLASGVHCVAMCGGFVAAFASKRVIRLEAVRTRQWRELAFFNAGRITSYAAAGAAVGFAGNAITGFVDAQAVFYVLANLVLIGAGLHLAGVPWLSALERIGVPLWRTLQPLLTTMVSRGNPFFAGLAWGWLPCGLVYAALAAAAFAGGAAAGAAAMAAYGIGTAPWLMGAGVVFSRLHQRIAGAAVLGFGVYGLAHAEGIAGGIRTLLCL